MTIHDPTELDAAGQSLVEPPEPSRTTTDLNQAVTMAILRAERICPNSPLYREVWRRVSELEEQIGGHPDMPQFEREIGMVGAVTAALRAGDHVRALALVQRSLSQELDPRVRQELLEHEGKLLVATSLPAPPRDWHWEAPVEYSAENPWYLTCPERWIIGEVRNTPLGWLWRINRAGGGAKESLASTRHEAGELLVTEAIREHAAQLAIDRVHLAWLKTVRPTPSELRARLVRYEAMAEQAEALAIAVSTTPLYDLPGPEPHHTDLPYYQQALELLELIKLLRLEGA